MRCLLACLIFTTGLWGAGREIVIVDTDSGLFGDDGAALVMLMRSPEQVTIPGVTIVPGNVWSAQGAEYTLHILELLKHPELPVYTGAVAPLIHTASMAHEYARRWGGLTYMGAFSQSESAVQLAPGAKPAQHKPRREQAVQFLISEIERAPGEVTILAIGPMTNIALAMCMRPDIETKIRRIVWMGGNVKVGGNATSLAEFNFWFDPEAARIVLRSRIPQKVMFALDICNTAPIKKAEFDQIAGAHTPITDLFRDDLGNRYPAFLKNPNGVAYMWDSLAAAYLLDPGFVTKSETEYLDVITAWGKFYGATTKLDRSVAPKATPVMVMQQLDYNRVFSLYRDKLTRPE